MVDEVGRFGGQPLLVLIDRGNRGLECLLAHFLGAMRHAAVEQLARIGHLGAFLGALLHALFEVVEVEIGHRHLRPPLSTSPRLRGEGLEGCTAVRSPMADKLLDFWFDFASTYSYPAAMRIESLAAAAGVKIRFRPFLLGPIFKAQGWGTSPFNIYSAKGRHMWRDLERLCRDLSLALRRPDPFPQNSLLPARVALVGLSEGW